MNKENEEKAVLRISEFMKETIDLVILGMMYDGPKRWMEVAEEDEVAHTTVDIKLPSEDVKKVIYSYLEMLEPMTTWTQGELESYLFGRLITRGLAGEAQVMGVYTKLDVVAKINEKMQKSQAIIDQLQSER